MRALELDFVAHRRIGNPVGILLLVAGLATVVTTSLDALQWAEQEQDMEARKAAELRRVKGLDHRARPSLAPRPEEVRALRDAAVVASRLRLPWQRLFDDTAAAAGDGVALTGLQPDAATHTARITGLTKDLQTANGFVERLQARPGFSNAYLVQHDLQGKDAEAALGIIVLATWREDGP